MYHDHWNESFVAWKRKTRIDDLIGKGLTFINDPFFKLNNYCLTNLSSLICILFKTNQVLENIFRSVFFFSLSYFLFFFLWIHLVVKTAFYLCFNPGYLLAYVPKGIQAARLFVLCLKNYVRHLFPFTNEIYTLLRYESF